VSASLSRADVAKVAHLARLRLSDEELDLFTEQLGNVLSHADDLNLIDLVGVEPMGHPFGLINVVRTDVVTPSLDRDVVLAVAPDARDGRFAVPKIVGEEP
jgi:aspartyl-tRNA(Asn)/glutamyl-tRNA(Gln) amidotransferase subunit C